MSIDVRKVLSSNISSENSLSETKRSVEAVRGQGDASFSGLSLEKGSVFLGQVVNISPKEITIKTETGAEMFAKYENLSELSIGDISKFKVMDVSDGRLILKNFTKGNSLENTAIKALELSGLPLSTKNMEMVTSLLKNGYPVNRPMLSKMLSQSMENPDISMKNLVLMNKADLPIDRDTSRIVEELNKEGEDIIFKVNEGVTLFEELVQNLETDTLIELSKEVFTILRKDSDSLDVNSFEIDNSDGLQQIDTKKIAESLDMEDRIKIFEKLENYDIDAETLQKLIKGEMTEGELNSILDTYLADGKEELSEEIPKLSYAKEVRETTNPFKVLEEVRELLYSNKPKEYKREILLSTEFQKQLRKIFLSRWSLSYESLSKKSEIVRLYDRFKNDVDSLLEGLKKLNIEDNDFNKYLKNSKERLDFINDFSKTYSFVEVPARFENEYSTGELYIYSNKNKKRSSDSISCLLHLDKPNLGKLNIRIELKENTVTTRFYVSDEKVSGLIEMNLPNLDISLSKQGFNPKSTVSKLKEENDEKMDGEYNLVSNFLKEEVEDKHYTRYSFDMRA